MAVAVSDRRSPLPLVNDDFVARYSSIELKKGRYLDTLRRIYEVVGAVDCYACPNAFLVHSPRYGNQLLKAIKHGTGSHKSQNELFTLQTEVAMLLMAEQVHPSMRRHLMTMTDRGTTMEFSYVIVNRPGPSLEYIYRNHCACEFSTWTLHHIAMQSLEAMRELHHAGYVLRDVSLQSFCIGYGAMGEEHLFINQALAIRPYIDVDGVLLRTTGKSTARPFSPYCASRARMRNENVLPQQDVEAWLWMMTCLHDASWLPLDAESSNEDKEQKAIEIKDALWKGETMLPELKESRLPSCYSLILRYLRQLDMADRVGYEHIRSLLDRCTPTGHTTYPLDWTLTEKARQLTEEYFLARCPRNKAAEMDADRTVTIRRDPRMDQHTFFTSRVVTTLKRNDASIESRSKATTVTKTEDKDKNPKTSGPVAKIPEAV